MKKLEISYSDYVAAQEARSHNHDDQRCRFLNIQAMKMYRKATSRNPRHLLDIGCRDACWFDDFEQDGIKCVGVEISKTSAGYAQSRGRNVHNADIATIIKGPAVPDSVTNADLVVMIHSLEHMLDPEAVLDWVADSLAPGGHVLIKQPDQAGQFVPGKKDHVCAFTKSEFIAMLQKRFDIIFYMPGCAQWTFILQRRGGPDPAVNIPQIDIDWWQRVPYPEWQAKYDAIMEDGWMRAKVGRSHRLSEKQWYVDRWFKKLRDGGKRVLDLGCGPSEFLEVARYHDNDVFGVDALSGGSLMGQKYWEYSKLTHERQMIDVMYADIYGMVQYGFPFNDNEFYWVNSQGALNQIFAKHLKWVDREGGNGIWQIDEHLKKAFFRFLSELNRITGDGGLILLYPNGSENNKDYCKAMKWAADKVGMKLVNDELNLVLQFEVRK